MRHSYVYVQPFNPILIKTLLVQRGLTVSELAERIGLPQPKVSKLIHGRVSDPAAQELIAQALGRPLAALTVDDPGRGFECRRGHVGPPLIWEKGRTRERCGWCFLQHIEHFATTTGLPSLHPRVLKLALAAYDDAERARERSAISA